MAGDHRDHVIEQFADSEHALARECAQLREALHAAVDRLRTLTLELDRLRAQQRRLQVEYRDLRAQILRGNRRAA